MRIGVPSHRDDFINASCRTTFPRDNATLGNLAKMLSALVRKCPSCSHQGGGGDPPIHAFGHSSRGSKWVGRKSMRRRCDETNFPSRRTGSGSDGARCLSSGASGTRDPPVAGARAAIGGSCSCRCLGRRCSKIRCCLTGVLQLKWMLSERGGGWGGGKQEGASLMVPWQTWTPQQSCSTEPDFVQLPSVGTAGRLARDAVTGWVIVGRSEEEQGCGGVVVGK
jgi:hypothetical protein